MPDSAAAPPALVLIANDQEWSARSLESILGPHGYAVVRAHTGRQALDLAHRTRPDIIIVDAGMPDVNGVELCRSMRADPRISPGTPIIITATGPSSRAERLEAFRAGAWEYCTQPIDAEALLCKLETFVASKRALDRSREDGLLDRETGLYNARGIARRAQEIGADAARRHTPLACVAVAPVAEPQETGDGTGDLAMRIAEHLAAIFRRTARHSDVVGHLGRSEFAIIAPSTEAAGALRLVERLRRMVDAEPMVVGGRTQPLAVRAGYSAVPDFGHASVDAMELLVRATSALRYGRSSGEREPVTAFEDVPVKFVH